MPSPEHAADLERILARAAQECESKRGIWFGEGLPQTLQRAIAVHGKVESHEPPEIGFVEVESVTPNGQASTASNTASLNCPLIGLSTAGVDELGSLVRADSEPGTQLSRLISPFAVFDFNEEGIQVREIRQGLTAADLQAKLTTTLWAGPDLKELSED